MNLKITYVFHNCFMLNDEHTVFLFDYPAARFLDPAMEQLILEGIKDRQLYYFVSHGHADHFNPEPAKIIETHPDGFYILSEDTYAEAANYTGNNDYLIPGETREIGALTVTTFESSDQGVAFLIRYQGKMIYYGGDLANWNWDELEPGEKLQMEQFYENFLTRLENYPIDLAFVNTDPRMKNWAGASAFLTRIQPKLFVPMHTFGKTSAIKRFVRGLPTGHPLIFEYQNGGDTVEIDL